MSHGTDARFPQTRWTLVLIAKAGDTGATVALNDLCTTYWYPVYAFLRRHGRTPHDAQDLTQGFFASVLSRDWLAKVGPEKGKFRNFVLACLSNYVKNEHAKATGPKRHPSGGFISLDQIQSEERFSKEPPSTDDPSRDFERDWARALIERVLERLKAIYTAEGKSEIFEALQPFLTGDAERGDYTPLAARLHTTEGALRAAATRLRERFRDLLREEVGHTVERPEDVDDEIRYLVGLHGR